MLRLRRLRAAGLAILLSLAVALPGPAEGTRARDLMQNPLEDLMNMEVRSVSKKEQKLADTAAAVYVITRDDIRRSGATSISELVRLAPGVNAALSYVSRLPGGNIPGYMRLDSGVRWSPGESLEFSVNGRDLLRPRHAEFPDVFPLLHMQIQRGLAGSVRWSF